MLVAHTEEETDGGVHIRREPPRALAQGDVGGGGRSGSCHVGDPFGVGVQKKGAILGRMAPVRTDTVMPDRALHRPHSPPHVDDAPPPAISGKGKGGSVEHGLILKKTLSNVKKNTYAKITANPASCQSPMGILSFFRKEPSNPGDGMRYHRANMAGCPFAAARNAQV